MLWKAYVDRRESLELFLIVQIGCLKRTVGTSQKRIVQIDTVVLGAGASGAPKQRSRKRSSRVILGKTHRRRTSSKRSRPSCSAEDSVSTHGLEIEQFYVRCLRVGETECTLALER